MWNEPSDQELEKLPPLYSTERQKPQDILIPMHFFLGGCDWYAAEYGPQDRVFFGYAILNNDLINSEWGYVSFDELREIKIPPGFEVDRDLYWKSKKASEIEEIVEAHRVRGLW